MARRIKDDTPIGGWLGPRMADEHGDRGPTGPAIRVATGVHKRSGQWIWKDATPEVYRAIEDAQRRERKRAERMKGR